MKKKKTLALKTTKRRTALTPAPSGLRLLLSLIIPGGPIDAIHARARAMVGDLESVRKMELKTLNAREATSLVFPGIENPRDPESALHAGLLLGAAVAWLTMTDLAGGPSYFSGAGGAR